MPKAEIFVPPPTIGLPEDSLYAEGHVPMRIPPQSPPPPGDMNKGFRAIEFTSLPDIARKLPSEV
jgi:hypothetical protein